MLFFVLAACYEEGSIRLELLITIACLSLSWLSACCSPPGIGTQISTLIARSLFPVHPLCAAIQSIGVCKRDLEGNRRFGLGRILFPAILLHGSFDFVLMVSAYFQERENIIEGNDDDGISEPSPSPSPSPDDDGSIGDQLPALISGLVFVITGYIYYVVQSRAQNRRLTTMDNAAREQSAPLVRNYETGQRKHRF